MLGKNTVSIQTQTPPTCIHFHHCQCFLNPFPPTLDLHALIYHLDQAKAILTASQSNSVSSCFDSQSQSHLMTIKPSNVVNSQKSVVYSNLLPLAIDISLQKPKNEEEVPFQGVRGQNYIQINEANQESFGASEANQLMSLINGIPDTYLEQPPLKFNFKIRDTPDLKYFHEQGGLISKLQQAQNLRRIVARYPISRVSAQQVSIKIVQTKKHYIYFGLVNEQQSKTKATVRPKNNSVISYLILGGKNLFVLDKNEEQKMPIIEPNSVLRFRVNQRAKKMEWFNDGWKIHATQFIDFQDEEWYPFVVLKDKGDSVLLL